MKWTKYELIAMHVELFKYFRTIVLFMIRFLMFNLIYAFFVLFYFVLLRQFNMQRTQINVFYIWIITKRTGFDKKNLNSLPCVSTMNRRFFFLFYHFVSTRHIFLETFSSRNFFNFCHLFIACCQNQVYSFFLKPSCDSNCG